MKKVFLALALLLLPLSAHADQPFSAFSTNLSSTVAVTNTFQNVQNLTNARLGCVVQNNGVSTNAMYVYFGPIASATKAAAVVLQNGQSVNCALPGGVNAVIRDQVSITGTSGDAYLANFQ